MRKDERDRPIEAFLSQSTGSAKSCAMIMLKRCLDGGF